MQFFKNFSLVKIVFFIFLICCNLAYAKKEFSEKELKKFTEIIEFGIPDQRKKVLYEIKNVKDEKAYSIIKKIVLEDKNPEVLTLALNLVNEFEIKGLEKKILEIYTESSSDPLKSEALRTLGKLKYKDAEKKALEVLKEDNKALKRSAIFALGELKTKKALEPLYDILDNMEAKDEVLQACIEAIGKIGNPKSIEKLKDVLENPGYSKYIRMYVPLALADIGGQKVVKILKRAANDKEYFIRIRAIFAISKLKNVDLNDLKPNIKAALKDSDVQVRLTALKVVKAIKDKSYIRFLEYLSEKDPNVKVRKEAIKVYSKIASESDVIDNFSKKLKTGDFYTKAFIIEAMQEMKLSKVLPILKDQFKKDNQTLRTEVLRLLGKKKDESEALNFLKEIALRKDWKGYAETVNKFRATAMRAVAAEGWDKAFSMLNKIATDFKDPLYITALKFIQYLDKERSKDYFLDKLKSMKQKPYAYRYQIIKSIYELRPKGVESDLEEAFFAEVDISVRNYIAQVLKAYGKNPKALEHQYQERLRKPLGEKKK